jgi:putative NADH-flavin reductase
MNLFILGATGKTGTSLVTQGLARGHTITAFGRTSLQVNRDSFVSIVGNPMRVDDLAEAIPGHDAVLSALGTRGLGSTSVLTESASAIIAAMMRARVQRLIVISSSLVDTTGNWLAHIAARTVLRHTANDQRAMETQVTESVLDWTVLRPARLGDGATTSRYVVSDASTGSQKSSAGISRGDVAHMMLDTVERKAYVKQIIWLRGVRA